eukprot:TRINITY_DN12561_c0_g2_i3.p5 TRINITY_DN12561_c0_g2~~TRINITY_DN12561_c0_g2_i3.p5  ORF type:complete len:125 (-),score=2.71 TRINITY_DN12561_c0_g2_i3:1887-2261(-)
MTRTRNVTTSIKLTNSSLVSSRSSKPSGASLCIPTVHFLPRSSVHALSMGLLQLHSQGKHTSSASAGLLSFWPQFIFKGSEAIHDRSSMLNSGASSNPVALTKAGTLWCKRWSNREQSCLWGSS